MIWNIHYSYDELSLINFIKNQANCEYDHMIKPNRVVKRHEKYLEGKIRRLTMTVIEQTKQNQLQIFSF